MIIPCDSTVLTVNRRLSRSFRGLHDARQIAAGATAWPSPDILPYRAWLARCWTDHAGAAAGPVLLDPSQEQLLWEEVIREAPPPGSSRPLLNAPAAARAAREAHALLAEWRSGLDDCAPLNSDARAFREWRRAFLERCADAGWSAEAAAWDRVIEALDRRRPAPARRATFAGFDGYSPRQRWCMERLRGAGVEVREWRAEPCAASAQRALFASPEAELEAAARWARALLEDGAEGPIGIVLPELEHLRCRLEAVFEEVLCPGAALPGRSSAPRLFNISVGRPLAAVALVHDALLALALSSGRVATGDAARLLRSPYLAGGESELGARGMLLAGLQSAAAREVSIEALIGLAGAPRAAGGGRVPVLLQALQRLQRAGVRCGVQRSTAHWARAFWDALRCLGWPGERALDSDEYQAVEAFQKLLSSFARLAVVAPEVDAARALARLRRLALERIFQPRSEPAPIQILGVLETAGLRFSHLWLAGVHDGAWPRAARPHPFIPIALQRRQGMPGCGPEHELEFARRVTSRLLRSARAVIASSAERDGDRTLRPSPLLAHLPAVAPAAIAGSRVALYIDLLNAQRPRLEALADGRGPPLASGEAVRGGAALFRDQAACPFRAFARHRLHAEPPEVADPGLDAAARGQLAHRVLETVWTRLGDSAALAAIQPAPLQRLVSGAVEGALAALEAARGRALGARLRALEAVRLAQLVSDSLRAERRRAPFAVAAREREVTATVGGLRVAIRPDRVDLLAGGDRVLVDYKTGSAALGAWFGERPDDPQLPLYCVAYPQPISGAVYVMLGAGTAGFKGLAEHAGVAPGVTTPARSRIAPARAAASWEALCAGWRRVVVGLARGFRDGEAKVDPKLAAQTCRYCGLGALCRVAERAHGDSPQGPEHD